MQRLVPALPHAVVRGAYWLTFAAFYALMLAFVWPTAGKSLTLASLALCALLILTPTDHRLALLTFAAGAGLGYFLERWGTTRLCWTYYTRQAPPPFAVLAHGMAAVAFWRTGLLVRQMVRRLMETWQVSSGVPTPRCPDVPMYPSGPIGPHRAPSGLTRNLPGLVATGAKALKQAITSCERTCKEQR